MCVLSALGRPRLPPTAAALVLSTQPCADSCLFAVQGEMDELEREEFFRLKKVQAKKKVQQALRDKAALEVRGCFCLTAESMLCTSTLACTCPLGSCSLQPFHLPG